MVIEARESRVTFALVCATSKFCPSAEKTHKAKEVETASICLTWKLKWFSEDGLFHFASLFKTCRSNNVSFDCKMYYHKAALFLSSSFFILFYLFLIFFKSSAYVSSIFIPFFPVFGLGSLVYLLVQFPYLFSSLKASFLVFFHSVSLAVRFIWCTNCTV